MRRVTETLTKLLDEAGFIRSENMDFSSPRVTSAQGHESVFYYVLLQTLPETTRLPLLPMRVQFFVGIFAAQAQPPYDQNNKLLEAQDTIWKILRLPFNQHRLGIRGFQRVNDSTTIRGDLLIALNEYQCNAILRQGEYK